jgi:hypothetical protein
MNSPRGAAWKTAPAAKTAGVTVERFETGARKTRRVLSPCLLCACKRITYWRIKVVAAEQ